MAKAWEKIDLEGAGLQSVNQQLVHRLKRRARAYALWLLFPLGAHRLYLQSRPFAVLYTALTALTIILWMAAPDPRWGLLPLAAAGLLALYDLWWIDGRITALNKQLRMELYLGAGAAAPPGYRGRYVDEPDESPLEEYRREKEQERAGHQPVSGTATPSRKAPSFSEQEAMLRDLAKRRKRPGNGQD